MAVEVPYLLAGVTAVAGGYAKSGGWPATGTVAVVSTGVLMFVASMSAGTSLERLVAAFGWLLFGAAVFGAVPTLTNKGKA